MKEVIINMLFIIAASGIITGWVMGMQDTFWFKSPEYRRKKILEENCKSGDCKDTDCKYPDDVI